MTYAELTSGETWDDNVTPEQAVAAVKAARLEIGRLRAESKLHETMADLFQAERDNLSDKLEAEVARYRGALERIANWPSYRLPSAPDIARAALTPAEPPDTAPPPDRPAAPKPGPGSA